MEAHHRGISRLEICLGNEIWSTEMRNILVKIVFMSIVIDGPPLLASFQQNLGLLGSLLRFHVKCHVLLGDIW
jgi:hypothetical protein